MWEDMGTLTDERRIAKLERTVASMRSCIDHDAAQISELHQHILDLQGEVEAYHENATRLMDALYGLDAVRFISLPDGVKAAITKIIKAAEVMDM